MCIKHSSVTLKGTGHAASVDPVRSSGGVGAKPKNDADVAAAAVAATELTQLRGTVSPFNSAKSYFNLCCMMEIVVVTYMYALSC